MSNVENLNKKERLARNSMTAISLVGILVFFQFGLLKLQAPDSWSILVLLVLFLAIIELYPLPVWKGYTTISFPIVYTIYLRDGISFAIVSFALVSASINLIKQRPLRIVFFNPAQLVISLCLSYFISPMDLIFFPFAGQSKILHGIIQVTLLIVPFYVINNVIVDCILLIRPQKYTLKAWRQKTYQELNSFLISFLYLILLYFLGSQKSRGTADVFSFFFFFSPLITLSLLSSIIAHLKKEKSKLKALFSISSELNKKIATTDWLIFLSDNLQEFIDEDAWILWKRENEKWILKYASGLVNKEIVLTDEIMKIFDNSKRLKIYHNVKNAGGPAASFFDDEIRSLLYAPLFLDKELVGLFVFGRSRTKSFSEEDVTSAATLANQLAVLIKTRWLFSEQEKRLILEERNRIARDIHDGIAQSLAGAIMNLETAHRKFTKMPEDSHRLMLDSTEKLRKSLKEVRESIYALRPYPTERVGLLTAISTKIKVIEKDRHIPIIFDKRGNEFPLSPMVEKIIFDIFQESMQNSLKHADASKIEILLSYQKENVLLKIRDNGKGFSLFQAMIKAQNQPHFGILHMNEAAERIQASLQVDSKEGAGTEITLTVPRMGIEGGKSYDQAYASR
jgi:signal transduction histidine kinase